MGYVGLGAGDIGQKTQGRVRGEEDTGRGHGAGDTGLEQT